MSAFTVSKEHIDALVEFGEDHNAWDYAPCNQPNKVGQTLWDQNYRSVNYRYNETETAPVYEFKRINWRKFSAVDILSACDCLAYQSCETDDWPETDAYKILDCLRNRAIRALPGYEDAPWEIRKPQSKTNALGGEV